MSVCTKVRNQTYVPEDAGYGARKQKTAKLNKRNKQIKTHLLKIV